MINDLKSHPAMKDSGVPWLGQVPMDWTIKPLKQWVHINAKSLPETTPGDHRFQYIDIGSVGTGFLTKKPPTFQFDSAPSRARRVVREGDTIVSTVRTYLKAVYFNSEPISNLICSTGFAVLTPALDTIPQFVSYAVQANSFTDRVTASSVGIAYPAIAETRLGAFHVPVPPLDEQITIVRFLDHADRRIRRYIRVKQKLIKLLEEQKQAIIQLAVTRGLDPKVRLKPSGVEWLGDVPEHWEICRSRRLFSMQTELARPDDVQLSATQAYGVIPQSEFEAKVGRKVVRISMHLEKRRHVQKDDFVMSMRSFQGGLERAWASGAIRSSYVVLRPGPQADVNFFGHVFKSRGYIGALQATADFIRDGQDLTLDNFRRVDLPLIPLQEQKEIANYITESIQRVDANRSKLTREITLLREYRTRLVSDVVTGKLDVRGVAANLSDGSGELDDLPLTDEVEEGVNESELASEGLAEEDE